MLELLGFAGQRSSCHEASLYDEDGSPSARALALKGAGGDGLIVLPPGQRMNMTDPDLELSGALERAADDSSPLSLTASELGSAL